MKGVDPYYLERLSKPLKDGFFVPLAFYDMTGNMNAALLLSQIYYWHRPGVKGVAKMQHEFEGKTWLRKAHGDWWNEIRLTVGQVRPALRLLTELDLIDVKTGRFEGTNAVFIRIIFSKFYPAFDHACTKNHLSNSTDARKPPAELDRPPAKSALSSIVTETTQRLHKDHSETTQTSKSPEGKNGFEIRKDDFLSAADRKKYLEEETDSEQQKTNAAVREYLKQRRAQVAPGVRSNLWAPEELDEIRAHCEALGAVGWSLNTQWDRLTYLRSDEAERWTLEHVKELLTAIARANSNGGLLGADKEFPVLPTTFTDKLLPWIEKYAANPKIGMPELPHGWGPGWASLLLDGIKEPETEEERAWLAGITPAKRIEFSRALEKR